MHVFQQVAISKGKSYLKVQEPMPTLSRNEYKMSGTMWYNSALLTKVREQHGTVYMRAVSTKD